MERLATFFFFSSRRRHTRCSRDWSSDVCFPILPVLFVHGFPFDRTVWRHQLAALSRVRRIAPDLRGVGGSGVPPGADGYSLTRYADDLVAVLDALGVRQAVGWGLSMGEIGRGSGRERG